MKKLFLVGGIVTILFLGGCSLKSKNVSPPPSMPSSGDVSSGVVSTGLQALPGATVSGEIVSGKLLSGKSSRYPFAWKMEQPSSGKIKNIESMQYGFHETWSVTIPQKDLEDAAKQFNYETEKYESCESVAIINTDGRDVLQTITPREIAQGPLHVTGQYQGQ